MYMLYTYEITMVFVCERAVSKSSAFLILM